jgi:predicted oxidoreductase
MEYIVNQNQEEFKIIMFQYNNRNWEICFEFNKTEEEIQYLIQQRIEQLMDDYSIYGNYDNSDLFVDYIDNNENNI